MPPQELPPQFSQQPAQQPSYDFIFNPAAPPKKPLLPGAQSMALRIALVGGGILLLIILVVIVKSLIVGKPKLDSMVTVAQDQQELIHLASGASQQQGLSTDNKNLVATVQVSVTSAQQQILSYLATNHFKTDVKKLDQYANASLDQQLSDAASAGTYNQSLQNAFKQQLSNYQGDLSQAYNQVKGPKGHALLKSDFAQAQLLLDELNSASAVGS